MQPVVNRIVENESFVMPVFPKVPVIYMHGGGSSERFPIAVGDYCQLIVNERCLDNWYLGRDNLSPAEDRIQDYSDSVALVGLHPQSSALDIPDKITRIGELLNGR